MHSIFVHLILSVSSLLNLHNSLSVNSKRIIYYYSLISYFLLLLNYFPSLHLLVYPLTGFANLRILIQEKGLIIFFLKMTYKSPFHRSPFA